MKNVTSEIALYAGLYLPGQEIATTAAIGELDAVTLAIARAALTLLPA